MIDATSQNTCIVVVTFNPSQDFSNNIKRYCKIVDNIILVDNHSEDNISFFVPQKCSSSFKIIKSDENKGIAWGLNQGIQYAIQQGFQYILTFDQDSFPVSNILSLYTSILRKYTNVGLLGTSFSIDERPVATVHAKSKLTVITSGALHWIGVFRSVGLYDESLFIDSVDFDFSLRVKSAGLRVLRVKEPLLLHHLGNPIKKNGIQSSNHLPWRRYYMTRNHIIMTKRYWYKHPYWIIKKNFFFIWQIVCMILIEKDRNIKLHEILRGVRDGFES
jgi:rhamnosyltransferase